MSIQNAEESGTLSSEDLNEEQTFNEADPEEQVQDLREGEMVAANFDDGFWLGEVI